jgi:hypothetical protein
MSSQSSEPWWLNTRGNSNKNKLALFFGVFLNLTKARTEAGKHHWEEAADYFDEALLLPNVPLVEVHLGRA